MSGRPLGNPGLRDLNPAPLNPTPSPVSSIVVQSPVQYLAHVASNADAQSLSTSSQDRRERKAKLEQAFAAVNFNTAVVPHQSAAFHSGLYVPKRSRSPEKEGVPPFQYKSSPRPEGYHIASSGPGHSPHLPVAASFSKKAELSRQNPQQLRLIKPLPLLPVQEPVVESSNTGRVAPPRPPRSPGHYITFDPIVHPKFRSTSAPFVLPFGLGPSVGQVEEYSSLSPTQTSRAKPLLFNAAEPSASPQLVPPHEPGGYNPLENPYIPKPKSSSPKPTTKTSIWERGLRKFSGRPSHSRRDASPAGRHRSATSPFPRPKAPTPNRGRNVSEPQTNLSSPSTGKALGYKTSEIAPSSNKATKTKTLFSVAEDGAVIFNGGPHDNDWEVEALRKYRIQTKRAFNCSDLVFQGAEEHKVSFNQHQPNFQSFSETPAPQSTNCRDSQDSLKTLAIQPEGLGIYQTSVRPFSWQLPNSRTPLDSVATLVATPPESGIYRNPGGDYYSLNPGHQNRPRGVEAAEGIKEVGDLVEIPISTLEKSESSPVPSIFFEGNWEAVDNQASRRLPGEVDLSRSYPESVVENRSPRDQVHRTVEEASDQQLTRATTRRDGYRTAYYNLCNSRPTNSICELWAARNQDSNIGEETVDLRDLKSEEEVDVRRFPSPERHLEERSPSRGRGRVRESQSVPDEDIPRVEECSYAKRQAYRERKKEVRERHIGRITTPFDRQGPGEGVIDKFLAEQRELDSPGSLRPKAPAVGETGKPIGPNRTLSAARRGVERRQRLAAAPGEVGAFAGKHYFNVVLEPTTPLKQKVVEDPCRVDVRSDCSVKDLVAKFDCTPHIPKGTINRLGRPQHPPPPVGSPSPLFFTLHK
jgi:hypothetical protein